MRLLIMGGTGMLGHKLFHGLGHLYPETYATVRRSVSEEPFDRIPFFHSGNVIDGVDAENFSEVRRVIDELRPDYVLNCVGIIKHRKGALSPVPCITLNALLPHKLCEMTASYGGRVIHFSTDCVFDGWEGGYTEKDTPNAPDIYGRTKALGEVTSENGLTLRTSIIGRELVGHASLLDWFLAQDGQTIRGFTRAIYSGVTTTQMVNVVRMLLEQYPTLSGLYQVVADPISKYDLLCLARELYEVDVVIEPYDEFHMDRSMRGDKFEAATGYRSPAWPELMQDLVKENGLYSEWGIWP